MWDARCVDGPIPVPVDPEAEEPTYRPGYFLNVRRSVLADHPELEAFRVSPPRLWRVWEGDDPESPAETVPLRFADEAEAIAAMPMFRLA